ncbi:MAG: carbohydrate-binding protein, partial [Anaerolineae bacterium]
QWDATLVMVRQAHNRTIYNPDETSALFVVYRENANEVLDWIVGESVSVGTRRVYESVEYRCLQSHVTQADWTPPATPALWITTIEPGENWSAGVFYAIDALAIYESVEYRCLQAHVSQVGWEPPNVPALWVVNTPPTDEWQPYTHYTGDNTAGAGNGDVVTYNGSEYRCLQTHDSLPGWEPPNVPALWVAL